MGKVGWGQKGLLRKTEWVRNDPHGKVGRTENGPLGKVGWERE